MTAVDELIEVLDRTARVCRTWPANTDTPEPDRILHAVGRLQVDLDHLAIRLVNNTPQPGKPPTPPPPPRPANPPKGSVA